MSRNYPFLARLAQGPILADGAMGTQLYARGVHLSDCFDAANLDQPELVQAIHLDYLRAGAELIETNSFGANAIKLARHNLADQVRRINRQAARIARYARDIAGSSAFIAGSIGPLGQAIAPLGEITPAQARDAFLAQAEALLEGGVDLLILETFADLNELCLAIQTVQSLTDLPLIAQATFDEDGRTPRGQTPIKVVGALLDLNVDVIGVNCSVGPQKVLEVAQQMIAAGAPYVSAMPNAGMPTHSGGRLLYLSTPAYFDRMTTEMLSAGVRIVGGCCGTTPDHTAAMKASFDAYCKNKQIPVQIEPTPLRITIPKEEKGQQVQPTAFAQKLRAGKFVTSIELSPPKGFKTGALLRAARQIAESGVADAINVTDSPMARVRMSALAACFMIQAQTGMETVIHFTTRDRSLMGIQADLIGAHALGVRNILALTGDPPSLGTVAETGIGSTCGVFDIDSIGLARIINAMNQGHDIAGTEIGQPAGFCLGVAVDPTKPDLETEAARLHAKIAAGAEFIMTQPIYDLDVWHRFLTVFGAKIEIPVLLGLLPLLSDRHAEFLHNEIPGITLSEEALARMRAAGPNGRAEGIKMAQEFLLQAKDEFQGVYLMPSYNRVDIALEVLQVL